MVTPDEHTAHGYWLAEAGAIEPRPPLIDNLDADLCVVGGGYLGLWTAWFARRADPSARIVVIEAELCGQGPSGRNGGIASPVWGRMPWLRRRYGDEAALAVGRASAEAVVGVGEWCKAHGVDAWYQPHDLVEVSTSPSQDGRWLDGTIACAELGVGENYYPISAEEIGRHFRSDLIRGGAIMRPGATVQPARLAAGVRRALLDRGVAIYEHTRVLRTREDESGVVVGTTQGSIRSQAVVLAMNAAMAAWPGFRRRLSVTSSHMVISEPAPDVYEAHGWDGAPIVDHQTLLNYSRGTPDHRIAFGWGGGPMAFGGRLNGRIEVDHFSTQQAIAGLISFFPELEDRRVIHAWGGPIDVSPVHTPIFRRDGRICAGYGFTGNGVGPTFLGGQILADLALERQTPLTELKVVNPNGLPRFPSEPFRFVGASAIRRAMIRRDRAEAQGGHPWPITSFVANLPKRLNMNLPR